MAAAVRSTVELLYASARTTPSIATFFSENIEAGPGLATELQGTA